jgi:hypothetical protein
VSLLEILLLSCCVALCFVPSLWKSLYSWNSVKSIGKFTVIDAGVLLVFRKLDRYVVINTFQSGHEFVLDLLPSESASLADDGVLPVVRKLDRSVVINTFQSSHDFVLDLLPSEYASLANDKDYEFSQATFGHLFKANVTWKLYEDEYLILDYPSTFTGNPYALSISKHKVPKPVQSKSTEVFELIYTEVWRPFPNELYCRSKSFLTIIDDF